MRDDFTEEVKRILADRVGYHCSNPDCNALTAGPREHDVKAVNLGVAAHITAASPGGPRYNPNLTPEERRYPDNGIWLCQNHAKHIDNDPARFSEPLLRAWKTVAEDRARSSLGMTVPVRMNDAKLTPKLELFLEQEKISGYTYDPRMPVRWFILGLKNAGTGIAKFPSIRYRRSSGLAVDNFGIDGNGGFGLPQSPSEIEWVTFRGGFDNVIHAEATMKITRLWQNGDKPVIKAPSGSYIVMRTLKTSEEWTFRPTIFQCEISCEGVPTVKVEKSIQADSVEWMTF